MYGFYSRVVYNQEQFMIACVWYFILRFSDDLKTNEFLRPYASYVAESRGRESNVMMMSS